MYQPLFRGVVTALSLAVLPFVFAHDAHAAAFRPTATAAAAMRTNVHSWCLQNDIAGVTDCSFSDRNQCAATAGGGLGECIYIAPGAQPRD
jgi:GTP cyclohydrolase II